MADQTWIDVPAGCHLALKTSATGNYLADADVHYDMKTGATPRADYSVPQSSLDPGPATIPLANTGTASVIVGVVFVDATSSTVTVTATIKKSDGSNLTTPFSKPYTGKAGDGKHTCIILVRGDGV
jgi:hypothetical protein